MEATYLIRGHRYSSGLHDFQEVLKEAYEGKERPYCTCTKPNMPMYIARINNVFVVKRMPDSGAKHSPDCSHYECPIELTGLGEVSGSAIKEDVESGMVNLKVDFSLSKGGTRASPVPTGVEHDTVATDGKKLTLRSLLHYFWEISELNKWTPNMFNKRNWFVVRNAILSKSINLSTKNSTLHSMLFMPEFFNLDKKDEISKRRKEYLKDLMVKENGKQPLKIIIGEVKEIKSATFDYKMMIKHLPDMPIFVNKDLYSRMVKRFDKEMHLKSLDEEGHLIVIGTFGISDSGIASFNELSLMMTNQQWLPYENKDEFDLISRLVTNNRRFIRGLKYNLPSSKPTATALLIHGEAEKTALYIQHMNCTEAYRAEMDSLISESEYKSWVWDANEPMPVLPS